MKSFIYLIICSVAMLAFAVDIEHVTNGSFEEGPEVTMYDIAYEDADDWDFQTSTGNSVNYRVGNVSGAPWYKLPSDGDHFVSIHNLGNGKIQNAWFSQRLKPLVIGESYQVSIDVTGVRINPDAKSVYAVYIGNTLVLSGDIMRYGWYSYTATYRANDVDGESPLIRLVHINYSASDRWISFDNVSVFGAENLNPQPVVIDEQVANPSFEIGAQISGSGTMPGLGNTDYWTTDSDGQAYTQWRVAGSGAAAWYKSATDGSYFVGLANIGGAPMTSWFEQQLPALKVGEVYNVSFDVVLKPESDATLNTTFIAMIGQTEILRGTVQRYGTLDNNGWYKRSVDYVANEIDGESPVLKLMHYNHTGLNVTLLYDNINVEGLINPQPNACPTVYDAMDLNKDCYVDIKDFAIFSRDWLKFIDNE